MASSNGRPSQTRDLFGGALTTSLPGNVMDASDFRQVPDTQEVFLSEDSDNSIIFEILQVVSEGAAAADLREAAQFHFKSIAYDNTAFSTSIDTVSSPFPLPSSVGTPQQHLYATLEGTQTVSKFNKGEDEADLVKIFLAVIRVDLGPASSTTTSEIQQQSQDNARRGGDITICVNTPLGKASSIDRDELGQPKLSDSTRSLVIQAQEAFRNAVHDFKIVDYGLFA
ncbi:Mog1p/PsbP-like protein [Cystobasidium minutum MCA 4210]|uniref:Mog1p/PsbP-like protein n=1 Tax=Cystobasidium minutum MCA 4210 TaxID=1397322 RepID=UPI0034CE11BA|eukprot:jgi/Rhomi1/170962/fgenesh1_kg.4_\